MNSQQLPHPYIPLPDIGKDCLRWTVHFYNPRHTGNRDRLDRLEAQVRIVMKIATSLQITLKYQAKNACLKTDAVRQNIQKNLKSLIKDFKVNNYDTDDYDEEQEERDEDECRIASIFMRKRHLLNIIMFILGNEPQVAERHKAAMKDLTDLVEQDTEDWMEILDFVQTMKNPNYLEK